MSNISANSALIAKKLTKIEELLQSCKMAASSLDSKINLNLDKNKEIKDLILENDNLKKSIKIELEQLDELVAKRNEATDKSSESYPLPTPKVLKTSKVNATEDTNQEIQEKPSTTEIVNKKVKKEEKNKPKKVAEPVNEKIDVSRLNIVVGRVVEVQRHPDAEKLYVEKIDIGEAQPRTVVSGLVDYISIDNFRNKLVVALCNLKPAKLRGILSEAMVLCASDKENNKVELIEPPNNSVPGDRIVFDEYQGEPDVQLNPKKKVWEQVAPDLKTNDQRIATYKEAHFKVSGKGTCTAPTLSDTMIK